MNFDFSDDQKALGEEARRFLEAKSPPERVRVTFEAERARYDQELWQLLGAQGWLGICVPEEFGGLGLGHLELCVVAEELGRAMAPVPFASTAYLLTEAVVRYGSAGQREDVLPGIVVGDIVGALAVTERAGAGDFATMTTRVEGGRITGEKLPVTDGSIATHAIVAARENDASGLYLVDLGYSEVKREPLVSLDRSRDIARLRFDRAPAQRLGTPGEGQAMLSALLDRAAVLLAFEQIGGATKALEDARDYAIERFSFGRPIGSNQAIKHKLADVYADIELARANAWYGAWALANDAPELSLAASAARIAASRAYWVATRENIQTHGGIGYTWEMNCHLQYRHAQQLSLALGAPQVWKERLMREIERVELTA